MLAADAKRVLVERVERAVDPDLLIGGIGGEPFGLRHPRRPTEAERLAVGGPRNRDPAAVAALLGPVAASGDRVVEHIPRQFPDLRKAELFALVEVGRPGQAECD